MVQILREEFFPKAPLIEGRRGQRIGPRPYDDIVGASRFQITLEAATPSKELGLKIL